MFLRTICTIALGIAVWAAPPAAPVRGADLQEGSLKKVSFIPQWEPQAQFAGYYVAYEKGFYRARGLDVQLIRGGPGMPSAEVLAKGAADFGTMFLSTGIEESAKGTPLINIAQIVRKSTLVLIAKKSSGIGSPQDMEGKKVGLWGDELRLQPAALFRKYGIHVRAVPQSDTINLFLRGGVDVASAMFYNEYHTILSAGVDPEDLVVFPLADYGINFPEDGIYCLEKTFQQDPESCRRFVDASIEGWRYTFDHIEEALDIVMKYVNQANIATNRRHQKWMIEHMRDAIYPAGAGAPMGDLSEADYASVAHELEAGGMIDAAPSYSDFFVNCVGTDEK